MSRAVALAFVEAVNRHDVAGITALMTDDHQFVDAYGGRENKAQMEAGWAGYFEWFPDYLIEVDEVLEAGGTVALFGHAGGTWRGRATADGKGRWRLPAAWRVTVADGKVSRWQVYADSKRPYEAMRD